MKLKIFFGITLLIGCMHTAPALAGDPCKVTFCMWGKLNGASSKDCNSAEKEFFNIIKKKKGSFRPDKTFDARKSFLNQECPAVYGAGQQINMIMNKFGKVRL